MAPVVRARTPSVTRSRNPPDTTGAAGETKAEKKWAAKEATEAARLGLTVSQHRDRIGAVIADYHLKFEPKVRPWIAGKVQRSSFRSLLSVESLVQETFLRVQRAMLTGAHPNSPNTYLTRTGGNVVLDAIRKLRTQERAGFEIRSAPDSDADFYTRDVADPGLDPEAAIWNSECHQALQRALATLTPHERQAVLRDGGEQNESVLAAELGVSLGQVKSLAFRAKRKVAALVGAELGMTPALSSRRSGAKDHASVVPRSRSSAA